MINQTPDTSSVHNFAPEENVQTVVSNSGEWMTIGKAAEATGLHEKTLRRYIKAKKLKARRLGNQSNSPLQIWVTPELSKSVFAETSVVEDGTDLIDEQDEDDGAVEQENREDQVKRILTETMDGVIKTISAEFARRLDEQNKMLHTMQKEIVEKDRQILLIPDLKKQAEEKLAAEKLRLEEQIASLQAEVEKMRAENDALSQKPKSWWQWFIGSKP